MTKDEALTMAINQLKTADKVIQSLCPQGYIHPLLGPIHVAIIKSQEALAQPEQELVAWATREDFYRELDRSVNRMRQQMEIKGVVMRYADYDIALPVIDIRDGHVLVGQVTTPPQTEQEPMISKWVLREVYFDEDGEPISHRSPPQRKPLTDEELEAMAEKHVTNCYFDTLKFARAIEAAHGIKGEA